MDIEKQVHYWNSGSADDIETAEILLDKGRFLHGLFFCHLGAEKALKGLMVKRTGTPAPKTHNLMYLCSLSNIEPPEEILELFAILMKYQISGRYPESLPVMLEKETAFGYFNRTKEALSWLSKI